MRYRALGVGGPVLWCAFQPLLNNSFERQRGATRQIPPNSPSGAFRWLWRERARAGPTSWAHACKAQKQAIAGRNGRRVVTTGECGLDRLQRTAAKDRAKAMTAFVVEKGMRASARAKARKSAFAAPTLLVVFRIARSETRARQVNAARACSRGLDTSAGLSAGRSDHASAWTSFCPTCTRKHFGQPIGTFELFQGSLPTCPPSAGSPLQHRTAQALDHGAVAPPAGRRGMPAVARITQSNGPRGLGRRANGYINDFPRPPCATPALDSAPHQRDPRMLIGRERSKNR